jgi:hypothetical protein
MLLSMESEESIHTKSKSFEVCLKNYDAYGANLVPNTILTFEKFTHKA